jgi:hypothetical protein
MKFNFSQKIFGKVSSIKFNKNPSSESRVVPCGRTDITKLIVAFCNTENAPKETKTNLKYIWILSSHRAVNTFSLGYKNQSVNAVKGNP